MTPTNPLASSPQLSAAIRATRLYVLVRDAYLATPSITLRKLAALDELRATVTAQAATHPNPSAEAARPVEAPAPVEHVAPVEQVAQVEQGAQVEQVAQVEQATPADHRHQPDPPEALRGVRLVEWLRDTMHEASGQLGPADAAMALLEVMTSTAPPRLSACAPTGGAADGLDWSADPLALFLDAAGYLAPHLPVTTVTRMYRGHRQSRRLLAGASRLSFSPRGLVDAVGPQDAVADMMVAVLGISPPAAQAAAVLLLDGTPPERAGLAGAAIFDRLDGFAGPEAFVGTALGRSNPGSLSHHLATLESATRLRPAVRPRIAIGLEALREDLHAIRPVDEAEAARVRAARRCVEFAALRMLDRQSFGLFAASRMPRPRPWLPATDLT